MGTGNKNENSCDFLTKQTNFKDPFNDKGTEGFFERSSAMSLNPGILIDITFRVFLSRVPIPLIAGNMLIIVKSWRRQF